MRPRRVKQMDGTQSDVHRVSRMISIFLSQPLGSGAYWGNPPDTAAPLSSQPHCQGTVTKGVVVFFLQSAPTVDLRGVEQFGTDGRGRTAALV